MYGNTGIDPYPRSTTAIEISKCRVCGCSPLHPFTECPIVESVEFYQDGSIKKITKVRS